MKIRLLGTGYGDCKVKKKCSFDVRHKGGVVVDEKILIDAPEDVIDAAVSLGYPEIFKNISEIFISHSHKGHFSREAVEQLASKRKIRVFASGEVISLLEENKNVECVELFPFVPIELSTYRILPLPASHTVEGSCEVCFNFIISNEKTLFYCLDSAGITPPAFKMLKEERIDTAILECALENKDYSAKSMSHSNFQEAIKTRKILTDAKICREDSKFILSHIPTDRRRSIHEELTQIAKNNGFTVAYDGYFAVL